MAQLLQLKRAETPKFAYFLALFMVVSTGLSIGRGTADALFIKNFGIQYLPMMYVGLGVGMAMFSVVYAAYVDRVAPERTFVALLGGLALMLVGTWSMMMTPGMSAVYPLYYLLFEIGSELLVMHAAFYFSANFDPAQSKRLLPMTMAGLQLGDIAGGVILTLAPLIGVAGLVLTWAGLSVLGLAIIALRHRRIGVSPFFSPGRRGGGLTRTVDQITQGVKFIGRSSLLRYSAISVLFMVVALYSSGYAAYVIYSENFPTAAELSQLFGCLTIVSSALTLALQFFVTGRMLERFGVRNVNLLFPLSTLMTLVAIIASFGLGAAILSTLNRRVLMPAFRNPSRQLLFDALPDYIQGRARALFLVLVLPLGYILVGLVLTALKTWQAPYAYLAAGAAASLVFLIYSVKTNQAYVAALMTTLKERLFLPRSGLAMKGGAPDPALFGHLVEGVRHADEQVCMSYTKKLADSFPEQATPIILARMRDAGSPLRDALIRMIGPRLSAEQLAGLEDRARQGDAHEQATVLAMRFEANDPDAFERLDECFASANPRMVACGVLGVLRGGLEERRGAAIDQWRALLAGTGKDRIAAALDLGAEAPMPSTFLSRLCDLLEQGSDDVRRAVLTALRTGAPSADSRLAALLEEQSMSRDRRVRAACVECYRLLSPAERERMCVFALQDAHPDVVSAAMRVIGENHDALPQRVFEWLESSRAAPRRQQMAIACLAHESIPHPLLEDFATRKLADAALMAAAQRILAGEPDDGAAVTLFKIVIGERMAQTIDVALMAMESMSDTGALKVVHAALKSRDARQVARAREALSYVAHRALATQLEKLLSPDASDAAPAAAHLTDRAGILAWCRRHADDWLLNCAEQALAARPIPRGA